MCMRTNLVFPQNNSESNIPIAATVQERKLKHKGSVAWLAHLSGEWQSCSLCPTQQGFWGVEEVSPINRKNRCTDVQWQFCKWFMGGRWIERWMRSLRKPFLPQILSGEGQITGLFRGLKDADTNNSLISPRLSSFGFWFIWCLSQGHKPNEREDSQLR